MDQRAQRRRTQETGLLCRRTHADGMVRSTYSTDDASPAPGVQGVSSSALIGAGGLMAKFAR